MLTNGNITIYNPKLIDHNIVFYRCQIIGVWVIARFNNQLSTNIAVDTPRMIARIPLKAGSEKIYISPREYDNVPADTYYTLAPGCLMVRGLATPDEVTKAELMETYELVTVTAVHDNRYGVIASHRHWKLEGV